jgi:hypothetical protein
MQKYQINRQSRRRMLDAQKLLIKEASFACIKQSNISNNICKNRSSNVIKFKGYQGKGRRKGVFCEHIEEASSALA